MRRAVLIGVALIIAGCGEPRLDGSSESAMKASAAKITNSLDGTKKQRFQEAVQLVALSQVDMQAVLAGKQNLEGAYGGMIASLDGKTADEVIAQADQIKAEREAREKAQALKEIAELEAEQANAESAKTELAKFEVLKSRFYLEEQEYTYRKKPLIELAVKNGTAKPVSRAYFKGTIATPGRAVPWLVEEFNYSIPGGLESGESANWTLAPNMFGEWAKVDVPSDAVFTVEVIKLDGADSKSMYDASGLSESKKERLEKLKAKYPENT